MKNSFFERPTKANPSPKNCTFQALKRARLGSTKDALNRDVIQHLPPKTNVPKNEEIILVTKFADTGLGYIVLMYKAQNSRSKNQNSKGWLVLSWPVAPLSEHS